MKNLRTKAIILRRINFAEYDKIVTLLTETGIKTVLAKSVRKEKSRLAGGLELFSVSDVTIYNRDELSDIGRLTSAKIIKNFENIIKSYERVEFGYEVIKFSYELQKDVENDEWFYVLYEVFEALNEEKIKIEIVKIWFYLKLAEVGGYQLSLERDVDGEKIVANEKYDYSIYERGFKKKTNGKIDTPHLKYLKIMTQKPLHVVVKIGGVNEVLRDCLKISQSHAQI